MTQLSLIIFALSIYALSTFTFKKLYLVDKPNQFSKFHKIPIPYSGGTYLLLSIITIDIFFINLFNNDLFIYFFLIYIISLFDDIFVINSYLKLILQIFLIFSFIFFNDEVIIKSLGTYSNDIIVNLSIFSIPFTLICFLLLVNAINFIDGIDGLCSFNFLTMLLMILLIKFIFDNSINYSYLIIATLVFIFFLFNLTDNPFKSFLGDSGSTLIGLISAYLICYETNTNSYFHPTLAAWLLAYPVYDIFSTIIGRYLFKKNIFSKDNTHFHHLLSNIVRNKYIILLIIFIYIIVLNILGFYSYLVFGSIFSLLLFIILNFIHFFVSLFLRKFKSI